MHCKYYSALGQILSRILKRPPNLDKKIARSAGLQLSKALSSFCTMAENTDLKSAVFEAWGLVGSNPFSCLVTDMNGNIVCRLCQNTRCEDGCALGNAHSLIQTTGEFMFSNRRQDSVDTAFDPTAADANLREACKEWLSNNPDKDLSMLQSAFGPVS
jgi:hypothetical protein